MSETLTDPLLGRVVDGRYEIRERVAMGGMATVYLAFDRRLEREVALKAMHQPLSDDDQSREFVARFRREAKASARLMHPGIVHVYDQGIDGDLSYLTMEFVPGENVRARIAHEGTLTVGEALGVCEAILDALAAAHRLGLVHRDVKPENVLIDTDGRPRITDFGLARAVTEVTSSSDGIIMGSPAYLSPELIAHGEADPRTDVYAAGIMLFEMVTGRQPFTGESAIDIAVRHVHEDVPSPSSFAPWLPTEFDDLVAALTARNWDDRPSDAAAALVLVRATRAVMDDPTLDRRADPPSGMIAVLRDPDATTVLDTAAAGSTVALPVGIGRPFAAVTRLSDDQLDYDPEAVAPESSQRRGWWWVGAILAMFLVVGGAAMWWYNAIGPGAFTTVPPVTDETQLAATSILHSAGFTVNVKHIADDDVLEGNAVSTDPKAQQRVEKGTTVTLFISSGPTMTDVPTVVGKDESDANSALKDAGFEVGPPIKVNSDDIPKGQVTASDPQQGKSVRHDTTVTLTVSDGPAAIKIPDVVGKELADAKAALDEFALKVTVAHERTDDAPEGVVFKQDPKAESDGERTQEITITVSDGPPLITVGDYVGMSYDAGKRAAEKDGFQVTMNGRFAFLSKKENIVDQSLAPNQKVEKGTKLVLVYN